MAWETQVKFKWSTIETYSKIMLIVIARCTVPTLTDIWCTTKAVRISYHSDALAILKERWKDIKVKRVNITHSTIWMKSTMKNMMKKTMIITLILEPVPILKTRTCKDKCNTTNENQLSKWWVSIKTVTSTLILIQTRMSILVTASKMNGSIKRLSKPRP